MTLVIALKGDRKRIEEFNDNIRKIYFCYALRIINNRKLDI